MVSRNSSAPLITIAIPAFNHERYVKDAIESVLAQEFKDWELIIIDDGSTDSTPQIIDSYRGHSGIRIFHQENIGLSPTLNKAVRLARGKYFNFLPSDDFFHKAKLLKQADVILKRPELVCIFSDQIPVDANGKIIDTEETISHWHQVNFEDERQIVPHLFARNFIPAPSALIRLDTLRGIGGFDETLIFAQDYDLWLRLLPGRNAYWLHEPLLYYRWHGENLTFQAEEPINFERAYILVKALSRLQPQDIYPELRECSGKNMAREKALGYVRLTEQLVSSGLLELLPWCRLFLNMAGKLDPDLKIPKILLNKLEKRQAFLDLRDERLLELSKKLALTEGELAEFKNHVNKVSHLVELKTELQRYRQEVPDILAERKSLREEHKKLNEEYQRINDEFKKIEQEFKRAEKREKELSEWNASLDEKLHWLENYQKDLEAREKCLNRRFVRFILKFCSIFESGGKSLMKIGQQAWHLLPLGVRAKYGPKLKTRLLSSLARPQNFKKQNEPELRINEEAQHSRAGNPERKKLIKENKDTPLEPCITDKYPLVTVVLPIYNHASSARLAVESILNQSYPNIQIIIVDDGSTDDLERVLAPYTGRRNIIILQQENQKLPRALTNGFRFAEGTFYSWTSADNIMLPWQIETLAGFLLRKPHIDLTYGNVEIIDEQGRPLTNSDYRIQNQASTGSSVLSLPSEVKALDTVPDNFINAAFLYRQSVGQALGPYDPRLLGTEDYDYWLRTKELFAIEKVDTENVLYQYRVHKNSLSGRYGDSHIIHNVKRLIEEHQYRKRYFQEKFTAVFLSKNIVDESLEPVSYLVEGLFSQGCAFQVVTSDDLENAEDTFLPHKPLSDWLKTIRDNPGGKILVLSDWAEGIHRLEGIDADIWCGLLQQDSPVPDYSPPQGIVSRQLFLDDWKRFSSLPVLEKENSLLLPYPIKTLDMLRKAREDKFPVWQFPWQGGHICLFMGKIEELDTRLVSETAAAMENVDFVFASSERKANKKQEDIFKNTNVHLFHFDNIEQLYPLAGAVTAVWMPVKTSCARKVVHHAYGCALTIARPFIAPEKFRYAPDAPYWFGFDSEKACVQKIKRVLNCEPKRNLCDAYLERYSPAGIVKHLFSAANNDLFIEKRCGGKDAFGAKLPTVLAPPAKRKSIALEINSLDKGGLEEVVINLASQFDKNKFDITISCAERGGLLANKASKQGLNVKLFNGKTDLYEKFLRQSNINLLNSHYSDFGLGVCQKLGIPVVATIHNAYVWFDHAQRKAFRKKDKLINHYIAVSSSVKDYLSEVMGIAREKITVVPNGVDTVILKLISQIPPKVTRTKLGLSENDFVFLNPASIDGRKNHHAMISALSRLSKAHPEAKILCAGNVMDPAYFDGLKKRVAELGLEKNILFPGFIKEKADLYRLADAFLMPSLVEGWSIAKTEALYFGLPLILTDVGGARDVLKEEWIGILVPNSFGEITNLKGEELGIFTQETQPKNLAALVQAMEDMMERRSFWQSYSEDRKRLVEEKYSVENMVNQTSKIFKSVLNAQKPDTASITKNI